MNVESFQLSKEHKTYIHKKLMAVSCLKTYLTITARMIRELLEKKFDLQIKHGRRQIANCLIRIYYQVAKLKGFSFSGEKGFYKKSHVKKKLM